MNNKQLEQRVRDAAPPVDQSGPSVWPAVRARLRPRRSRVRPLLWAGAGLAAASLCAAELVQNPVQPAPPPLVSPTVPIHVTETMPTPAAKLIKRAAPHIRKETLAMRPARPHPSHIAYRRTLDTAPPAQSPVPDKDAPRVQSATLVHDPAPQSNAPRAVPHMATENALPPKPVE